MHVTHATDDALLRNRPTGDALPSRRILRCVRWMHGRPRSFWIPLVAAVERGADLRRIADRRGVNPSTLARWPTVSRREQRAGGPVMLPVVVRPSPRPNPASASAHVELLVAGTTLRVPVGADVQCVAALARALERACRFLTSLRMAAVA